MIEKIDELVGEKLVSLAESMADKIITEIMREAADDVAALQSAKDRLETTRGIRADYLTQLEAKKAESENIKKIETGSDITILNDKIKAGIKARRALQDDIHVLEDLIAEIDQNVLPEAETAVKNSSEHVRGTLEPKILKTKEIYQQRLDALFSDAIDIMVAFKDAVFLVKARPELKTISLSSISTLIEFNVDKAPSSDFALRTRLKLHRQ